MVTESHSKVISFSGLERCDFAYYIAKTLAAKANVLVIDNSYNADLFDAVDCFIENFAVQKGSITFIKNVAFSRELFDQFDYVVIYQGMNIDKKSMYESDFSFILPDYTPYSLKQFSELEEDLLNKSEIIMRDKVSGKINEKTVLEFLKISKDNLIGFIPYDEKDYSYYISLAYNGRQKIQGLSPNYVDALAYVITKVMDVTTKDAKTILKKGKGGK